MRSDDHALRQLHASRKLLEQRLAEVQRTLRSEVGWAPSSRSWILLTAALSSGMALAYWFRSRRD